MKNGLAEARTKTTGSASAEARKKNSTEQRRRQVK